MEQKEVTDSSYDFGRIESESQNYYNGLMQENGNGVVREKLDNKTHLTFDDVHIKPSYSSIKSRSLCDTTTRLTRNVELDAPFVASPMDTVCEEDMAVEMWLRGGTGIIHRFDDIETQAERVKEAHERITKIKSDAESGRLVWEATDERIETLANRDVVVSAAIGATGDYLDRAEALIEAGANVLLIDVAHGHHQFVHNALTELKMKWPDVDVIAGSIATGSAAEALISWGADALRVGIGNGCFTPDMPVLTEAGVKPIKNVEVGDRVLTHNNRWMPVVNLFEYDRDEEIMVIDGVECTKNHEFYVVHEDYVDEVNEDNIHEYAEWIRADELTDKYFKVEYE